VTIIYSIGLAIALLTGGAIGLFLMLAHYERISSQQREYERELAEGRDFYAALAMFRHIKPVDPNDDEASAA
jgi:hypothetical protein